MSDAGGAGEGDLPQARIGDQRFGQNFRSVVSLLGMRAIVVATVGGVLPAPGAIDVTLRPPGNTLPVA